jgi:O-antigen ligase
MASFALNRRLHIYAAAAVAGVLLSYLAGTRPGLAVAAAGGGAILALAFTAPVVLFTVILGVAAIVPVSIQNQYAGGGPGLVAIDALMLIGLAWALFALIDIARQRIDGRLAAGIGLLILALGLVTMQLLHGIRLGHETGASGTEWRGFLGLGTALIAIPLLLRADTRRQVYAGMAVIGLMLGLWGIFQWVVQLAPDAAGDIGISNGVLHTTTGTGQLLGGRYAFPAVIILTLAALLSERRRSANETWLLLAILGLNGICLVLTFERAFWLATIFGVMIVVLRTGRVRRARAIVWGIAALLVVSAAFSVVAPGQATAVRERFLSLGQGGSDTSVNYRLIESRHVIEKIHEHELTGSGLGATIYWGRPAEGVPPSFQVYSHNAYLRLAWKLGIPAALIVLALFLVALSGRRTRDPSNAVLHSGARAGLAAALPSAEPDPAALEPDPAPA